MSNSSRVTCIRAGESRQSASRRLKKTRGRLERRKTDSSAKFPRFETDSREGNEIFTSGEELVEGMLFQGRSMYP